MKVDIFESFFLFQQSPSIHYLNMVILFYFSQNMIFLGFISPKTSLCTLAKDFCVAIVQNFGGKKLVKERQTFLNVDLDVAPIDITPNIVHHWNCFWWRRSCLHGSLTVKQISSFSCKIINFFLCIDLN